MESKAEKFNYSSLFQRAKANIKFVGSEAKFTPPELRIDVIGRKTIIRNFVDFCDFFRRDPKQVARYLFRQLGIPGTIEGKRLILQQRYDERTIKKVLDEYLEYYVYCKECGSKDTVILKRGKNIYLRCEACGAERGLRKVK